MLVDGLTFMVLFAVVLVVFVVGVGVSDLMLRVWDWARRAYRIHAFKKECRNFPTSKHDDIPDALNLRQRGKP